MKEKNSAITILYNMSTTHKGKIYKDSVRGDVVSGKYINACNIYGNEIIAKELAADFIRSTTTLSANDISIPCKPNEGGVLVCNTTELHAQ